MRTARDRDRVRRQQRQRKLRYLRQRLARTTNPAERRRLIERIHRVSPTAPTPEG